MVSVIVYYFLLHFTAFDLRLQHQISVFMRCACVCVHRLCIHLNVCWTNARFLFFDEVATKHQQKKKHKKDLASCIGAYADEKNNVILYDSIRIIYFLCSSFLLFLIFLLSIYPSDMSCLKRIYSKLNTIFYTQVKIFWIQSLQATRWFTRDRTLGIDRFGFEKFECFIHQFWLSFWIFCLVNK